MTGEPYEINFTPEAVRQLMDLIADDPELARSISEALERIGQLGPDAADQYYCDIHRWVPVAEEKDHYACQ